MQEQLDSGNNMYISIVSQKSSRLINILQHFHSGYVYFHEIL